MTTAREPYRSVEFIAAWLGIRPATVREWAKAGIITGHQPGGRVWLFLESEVEADIARSGQKSVEVVPETPRRSRPVLISSQPVTSIRDAIRRGEIGAPASRPGPARVKRMRRAS